MLLLFYIIFKYFKSEKTLAEANEEIPLSEGASF